MNADLKEYIRSCTFPDAAHIRNLGYGSVADLVVAGGMDNKMLLDLIEMADGNSQEYPDRAAGLAIFKHCCGDKNMHTKAEALVNNTAEAAKAEAKLSSNCESGKTQMH